MKRYALWTAQFTGFLIAALAVSLIANAVIGDESILELIEILLNV